MVRVHSSVTHATALEGKHAGFSQALRAVSGCVQRFLDEGHGSWALLPAAIETLPPLIVDTPA